MESTSASRKDRCHWRLDATMYTAAWLTAEFSPNPWDVKFAARPTSQLGNSISVRAIKHTDMSSWVKRQSQRPRQNVGRMLYPTTQKSRLTFFLCVNLSNKIILQARSLRKPGTACGYECTVDYVTKRKENRKPTARMQPLPAKQIQIKCNTLSAAAMIQQKFHNF